MKCTIKVDMDNAAFDDDPLQELRRAITEGMDNMTPPHGIALIRDINGNRTGSIVIK